MSSSAVIFFKLSRTHAHTHMHTQGKWRRHTSAYKSFDQVEIDPPCLPPWEAKKAVNLCFFYRCTFAISIIFN